MSRKFEGLRGLASLINVVEHLLPVRIETLRRQHYDAATPQRVRPKALNELMAVVDSRRG